MKRQIRRRQVPYGPNQYLLDTGYIYARVTRKNGQGVTLKEQIV